MKIGQVPVRLIKFSFLIFKIVHSEFKFYIVHFKFQMPFKLNLKFWKLVFIIPLISIVIFGYSYFLVKVASNLPNPQKLSELENPLTTKFYDRGGKLLYQAYEGKNRSLVKLDVLPAYLINATIAIEDKHFRNHKGVDLFAMLRALYSNLYGKEFQGGSTITQQLIKNTLLTSERTYIRKLKEIVLAYWAEKIYTKDEILTMYFNEAPYGGTAWGIEAAAETYFNKKARELTLAESTFLAGLPASPTEYSPFGQHPEYAKKRQRQVLDRMVEDGYISRTQAKLAFDEELKFNTPQNIIKAPHFVMYVKSYLSQKYGEKIVSQGGLKVVTTLDLSLQAKAEQIVLEEVEKLKPLHVTNGAAMITDARSGQILAMVGSKDYFDPSGGNYNVALALRPPGSSIKPITYVAGFKQGYTPSTILLDIPVVFKNAWETYTPINYDNSFHGPVTIRTALASSYNIPAVKMAALVGVPNLIQTAREMGITTFIDPSRYGLSLTLGGGEVKMIDMMTVYGTLSQMGSKYEPTGILKVTDPYGVTLEDNQQRAGLKVLDPGVAYMVTDILTDNKARTPAFGPNSYLVIPGQRVAVKTGTTERKRDNWTFGYTKEFVVGVWVGNNDNSPMNQALASGITGAAPIWNQLMSFVLEGREDLAFERPSDIAEAIVDGKKDLVLNGKTPKRVVGFGKKKIKDDKTQEEKEVITFTDPFNTYIPQSPIIKTP